MTETTELTLASARERLARRQRNQERDQREEYTTQRFSRVPAEDIVRMWARGELEDGTALADSEDFSALVEAWCRCFDAMPNFDEYGSEADAATSDDATRSNVPVGTDAVILGPAKAALLLNVSISTVNRWEKQGVLPPKTTQEGRERVKGWRLSLLLELKDQGLGRDELQRRKG